MSSSIFCARFCMDFVKKKDVLIEVCIRDLNEEHAYCIVAEWETHEAMQQHFLTQKFEVLIGAAKVLGETFEMMMAEILKTGGFKLSRK